MHLRRSIFFPVLILMLMTIGFAADAPKVNLVNHSNMKTSAADVNISISSAETNDCVLELEITNIADKGLFLYENREGAILLIKLRDKDGVSHDIGESEGSSQMRKIRPGETRKFRTKLQSYFRLKPGIWTLECEISLFKENGKDARVKMPNIQFEISKSKLTNQ